MPAKGLRIAPSMLIGLGATLAAWGQQPFADANCPEFDEFVQEYELVGEMGGPPEFPLRRVRVRIEYLHGDHFMSQETREWHWDPGPDGCALGVPRVVRAYRMRIGREGGVDRSNWNIP